MKRSLVRITAIAVKEWIQIRRDLRSLIFALLGPVFLLLLFGYALTMDVRHLKTAVLDYDKSSQSRGFLELFSHNEYFDITDYTASLKSADELFNHNAISLCIVIPNDFSKNIINGKESTVQIIVDGADSTSANVGLSYVKLLSLQYNRNMMNEVILKNGLGKTATPVSVETRMWFNETMETRNFILPGLIALILAIISALIASLTISREIERGTFETLLSTPVRPSEIVFGKLIPYLLIGVFDVCIAFMAGHYLFNLEVKGYFFQLLIVSLLFLTGTSAFGMLVSAATKMQVLSVQIAIVITYMPTLILSGFIFPIKNMPVIIQGLTYIIPARYLIDVIKDVAMKGLGASFLTWQIFFLSVYALIVLTLTILKMRSFMPYAGGNDD